jgi:hypothetical protein
MEKYRIVKDVGVHYVKFTVVEWLPVFIDEGACRLITELSKWNYVGGNPVNLTDPSGNFPPIWCQFMPNKALYEGCVDHWYGIEPINRLGEFVDEERVCYTGPDEYRAPGHFQGTGLTLAIPSIINWGFEIESVYDFATFEHSYFINGTDQIPILPGVGASGFVWGGTLDQYAGFVYGFRTNTSIGSDYSGPALTGFFGASLGLGPAGIDPLGPSVGIGSAGFVSITDPKKLTYSNSISISSLSGHSSMRSISMSPNKPSWRACTR